MSRCSCMFVLDSAEDTFRDRGGPASSAEPSSSLVSASLEGLQISFRRNSSALLSLVRSSCSLSRCGCVGLCVTYTTSTSADVDVLLHTSGLRLARDLCITVIIFLSFSFQQRHLHLDPLQPAGRAVCFCIPHRDIDPVSFRCS